MDFNGSDQPRQKNSVSSQKSISGDDFNASVGSDPNLEGILDLSEHELEDGEPFIKRIRFSQIGVDANTRSKAIIGKMFFKTKLCCKFRAGICPYITNCNFAHGIEELRRPPPNWQDIIALYEEQGGSTTPETIREENQIPSFTSYDISGDSQRSYKGRHCKKYYTDEGCPYGENCTFLHDEQSRVRESVAISLSPAQNNMNPQNQKPSNWKTRICNKWETTGSCPFGTKCHFAHGLQELHRYGGGLVDTVEGKEQSGISVSETGGGGGGGQNSEGVLNGGSRIPCVIQKQNSQFHLLHKWKGPEKISRIYGDWIDDFQ